MSRNLTIYQNEGLMSKAIEIGNAFAASGMFGTTNAAQGVVLAIECYATGMTPSQILQKYHIIKGRLVPKTDWIQSEFLSRGGKIIWKRWDKDEARAVFIKDGQEIEYSYTFEEAKEDGICFGSGNTLKDNWKSSRPDMLRARICKKAIKMLDPAIEADDSDDNQPTQKELELALKVKEMEVKGPLFSEGVKIQSETAKKSTNFEVVDAEVEEEEKAEEDAKNDQSEAEQKEDPLEEVAEEENLVEEEKETQASKEKTIIEQLQENEVSVNKFLIAKSMIGKGQTFRDLPENKFKMIEARIQKGTFFDSVSNFIKTENKEV